MGNRAIIAFEGMKTGLYLHWNGGPESVYAFLDYADQTVGKERGWDDNYCVARLCQIIGNYFGGALSLGLVDVDTKQLKKTADEAGVGCDGGVYVVGPASNSADGNHYRMVARFRTRAFTDDEIADEARRARLHPYWEKSAILTDIAAKNDPFFQKAA